MGYCRVEGHWAVAAAVAGAGNVCLLCTLDAVADYGPCGRLFCRWEERAQKPIGGLSNTALKLARATRFEGARL